MKQPRISFFDIESSHNLVATFSLFKPIIPHGAILKERHIICASWKYAGCKTVHSVSLLDDPKRFKRDRSDDFIVIKAIHEMLSNTDILVAHNGDRFDLRYFNTRALYHGLPPIGKITTVDTLKVARRYFNFNSNRLDYIGGYLGVGRKTHTSLDMWLAIIDPQRSIEDAAAAILKMRRYNRNDVRLLEEVYYKLLPYTINHPNVANFIDTDKPVCTRCGSSNLQKRGFHTTVGGKKQRYGCNDCGAWSLERAVVSKSVLTKES
jgi:DNA polymerase elongation subunit (family B)